MTPPPYKIVAAPSPKKLKLSDQTTGEEEGTQELTTPVESECDGEGHAMELDYSSDQELADQTPDEEEKKMTTPVESDHSTEPEYMSDYEEHLYLDEGEEMESDGEDHDVESEYLRDQEYEYHALEPEYSSDQTDEDISVYPDHIRAKFPNLTIIEEPPPIPVTITITEEERRLFCPPENPRFQLCCFQVQFKNYKRRGKLFGSILASVDSSSPDPCADLPSATLFQRELGDSLVVRNLSYVQHIYPTCGRPIPASTYIDIIPELYLITHDEDNLSFIEVANGYFTLNFLKSWIKGCYEGGHSVVLEGEHGSVRLYYIVIRHAVDAVLEITFEAQPELCIKPEYTVLITAYYGPDFKTYKSDSEKDYYKLKLFKSGPMALLTTGKIPLLLSMVAVPAKSSLVINAWVHNSKSWYTHMDHDYVFPAQLKNISDSACFEGKDCSLNVTVNWKYELAT